MTRAPLVVPLPVMSEIERHGLTIHRPAHVLLSDDAMVLVSPPHRDDLPFTSFAGLRATHDSLTVFLEAGDRIRLSGQPQLDALARRIESAICTFPELLVTLRSFARERSAAGSDHDRWYAGLLHARRMAQESRTLDTQRRSFDAARLQRAAAAAREGWACERYPEAGPNQRALLAELEDCTAGYTAALVALEAAAAQVQQAPDSARFTAWRAWLRTLQQAFEAADVAWTALIPVLCDSRGREGRLWRKLLKRGSRAIPDLPPDDAEGPVP